MKASEWRLVGDEEMLKSEHDLKKELFDLRFQAATEALENPARMRQIRRDLARIQTVKRERTHGEGSGEARREGQDQ